MPMRLRDLTVTRVALVPKGANPGAHIVLFRHDPSTPGPLSDAVDGCVPAPAPLPAADAAPVTRTLSVYAGPRHTCAITSSKDVTDAVRMVRKNKDLAHPRTRSRIKRRIIAIAKAKGPAFVDKLPTAWRVVKTQFTDVQADYELMEKKEEAWEAISSYMDSLRLAMGMTLFAGDGPMSDIDQSIGQFRDAVATALTDVS